jgi:hypothetical protein
MPAARGCSPKYDLDLSRISDEELVVMAKQCDYQPAALGKKLGSGGAMNRSINTTAAQERFVGGVNDGIHIKLRDVPLDHTNSVCQSDCHSDLDCMPDGFL